MSCTVAHRFALKITKDDIKNMCMIHGITIAPLHLVSSSIKDTLRKTTQSFWDFLQDTYTP